MAPASDNTASLSASWARNWTVSLEAQRQVSTFYFQLFNRTVFQNRLPSNTAIYWNKRLLTTAGRCLQAALGLKRVAFIQLSVKICDTPERIRDTLLHEMCHAATWVLDGIQHTDHGVSFQYWAERANRLHPEIPPINSFHTYTIRTKYVYRCQDCHNRVGRHSKSIDVNRQRCAMCGGRFQLQEGRSSAKTRTGTGREAGWSDSVARFVRNNLNKMKKRHRLLSRQQLVHKLTEQYYDIKNKSR